MPNSKIVAAIGNVDGMNTTFSAGEPYMPGYTRYILNGRIHAAHSDDYDFTESNPDTGEITVAVPPADGDVVQLFIIDRRPTVISEVQQLTGTVRTTGRLQGALRPASVPRLQGTLAAKKLTGALRSPTPARLQGTTQRSRLVGQLKKVC